MPLFQNTHISGFKDRPLLFLDFEMTGLDVDSHEIVEIAALVVSQPDFVVTNSYYTKVIPLHPETGDPKSLEISGYDSALWGDAIPLHQALVELSQLAPGCLLAGWAVQNEWDFLIHALNQEHLPYFFDEKLIDVVSLAYAAFCADSRLDRLSLANVSRLLSIPLQQHKPDSDIRATFAIFKQLMLLSTSQQNPAGV